MTEPSAVTRAGMIGLGAMGLQMARHMAAKGLAVAGYDIVDAALERAAEHGVQRCASPGDRRVKVLALTPAGTRLREKLLKQMTRRHLPLARLTPDEQRTLIRILERLMDDEW